MACVPPLRRGPRIARTSCTAIRLPCWGTLSDSRRISAIFQGGFYTGSWCIAQGLDALGAHGSSEKIASARPTR